MRNTVQDDAFFSGAQNPHSYVFSLSEIISD